MKVEVKRPAGQASAPYALYAVGGVFALAAGVGIGVAVGRATMPTGTTVATAPAASTAADDEWCYKFNASAYNNSGAWVPDIDLKTTSKAWGWEHGYWVGDMSFYGASKEAHESAAWPCERCDLRTISASASSSPIPASTSAPSPLTSPHHHRRTDKYDHYRGFLRLCVRGAEFVQRNIFVYPPQSAAFCEAHGYHNATTGSTTAKLAPGGGVCGVHGNEKLWEAGPLFASDCKGGIEGPYETPYGTYFTNVSVVGPEVVMYNVWAPTRGEVRPDENSILIQNQVTSFGRDGATRFRTAQGLFPTESLSYYTETKNERAAFFAALAQARSDFGVRDEDQCKFDGNGLPTGRNAASCAAFFDDFFGGCD